MTLGHRFYTIAKPMRSIKHPSTKTAKTFSISDIQLTEHKLCTTFDIYSASFLFSAYTLSAFLCTAQMPTTRLAPAYVAWSEECEHYTKQGVCAMQSKCWYKCWNCKYRGVLVLGKCLYLVTWYQARQVLGKPIYN